MKFFAKNAMLALTVGAVTIFTSCDTEPEVPEVDTTAPTLTLTGDAEVFIEIGSTYEDAGATATDDVDGDITASVMVTGADAVDTSLPAQFTVTYDITDAAGNTAQATRTVTVTWNGGNANDGGLIGDGGFEDGGTGWDGNALQVLTFGDNSFQYADVQAAGNVYDVNLSYGLEIESGGVYELTFTAFSDVDRTIVVGVGLYEDPWTAAVEEVTLSSTPAEFTYSLTADGFGIANSRAIFDMGGAIGKVYIDNVRLVKTN